jgi:fatty acid amide hydrolase 2
LWNELAKSIFGCSEYTLQALYFYALQSTGGLVPSRKREGYIRRGKELRQRILDKLQTNGVFFFPTFPQPAMRHNESILKLSGVMYSMFFNIMGFPSTHVPASIN